MKTLLHQYFDEMLEFFPSFASYMGDRSSDDKYEISISPSFQKRWLKVVKHYMKKVDDSMATSKGGKKSETRTYVDIEIETLRYLLKMTLEGCKFQFHLIPISSFVNPVLDFSFMERTMYPFNVDNIRLRHACYIKFFKQCKRNMKIGMKKGYVIPKVICERVINDIENFISNKEYITRDTPELQVFFEAKYKPVIQSFLTFIKDEYFHKCQDSISLCDLPKGKEMYRFLVKDNTTLQISPEEVHALGLSEVKRIRGEIKRLIPDIYGNEGANSKMNILKFMTMVQTNPKNLMKDPQMIFEAYRKKQVELRRDLIPKFFHDQVTPYEIHRVPKMLEASSAGAFYYPGNKTRPGKFYINLRDVKENPKFIIETLAIHEGEPGHHYQFQYMIDKGLPLYKIFCHEGTAFVEGWALYAESLSQSTDPLTKFGRLTYEIFRAVRCVVDTGIHFYGWTYKEALDYMVRNVALTKSELETEILRYICIPGQAVAYKVGERFWYQERANFLERNPAKTIKDYHEYVLANGVLPLCVLKQLN